jgi:hypothetical protein
MGQDLSAIHFGEVKIQQDKVGTGGMYVGAHVLQKCHSIHAVTSNVQMDGPIGIAEGFLRQPDVTGAVFDQQNFYRHTFSSDGLHDFLSIRNTLPQSLTRLGYVAAT